MYTSNTKILKDNAYMYKIFLLRYISMYRSTLYYPHFSYSAVDVTLNFAKLKVSL